MVFRLVADNWKFCNNDLAASKATSPSSTIASIPAHVLFRRITDEEQYRMDRKA